MDISFSSDFEALLQGDPILEGPEDVENTEEFMTQVGHDVEVHGPVDMGSDCEEAPGAPPIPAPGNATTEDTDDIEEEEDLGRRRKKDSSKKKKRVKRTPGQRYGKVENYFGKPYLVRQFVFCFDLVIVLCGSLFGSLLFVADFDLVIVNRDD